MTRKNLPDLHDAVVVSIDVKVEARTLAIDIYFYQKPADAVRVLGRIEFSDVTFVAQNINFEDMIRNRSAGNVTYWAPSDTVGGTHIYFSHGYVLVHASPPRITLKGAEE